MKTKNAWQRITVLMLAFLLCFLAVSCKKDKKNEDDEIFHTNVKRVGHAVYGNFVYSKWDKIFRFNTKTETFTGACQDPECDGMCPVDSIFPVITGVYDGRLYFCARQQRTNNVFLAYQDIATGEIKVLKTLDRIEDSGGYLTFIDGGYMYYQCMILKDGGDAVKSSDYEPYICRIPIDGGKEEIIFKCESVETLQMAAEGKLITLHNGKLYSIDAETKERKELYDYNANGYFGKASFVSYLDGKIYFTAVSGLTQTDVYTKKNHNLDFLIWVEVNTGQTGRVIDTPITTFSITDDAIYYAPFKLQHTYVPDDYEKHPENVTTRLSDDSLYACDLDGKNSRKVYTNDTMYYSADFIVVNGVIYGWMLDYIEETHSFGNAFFGAIDMESGKIVRTTTPE